MAHQSEGDGRGRHGDDPGRDAGLHRCAQAVGGRRTATRATGRTAPGGRSSRAGGRTAAGRGRAGGSRRPRGTGAARDDAERLGVPGRAEPADDGDGDDGRDAAGHLLDLHGREPAPGALLQVLAHTPLGAGAQLAPGVAAELVGVAGALLVAGQRGADVGLEVGLLQALAGPAGQYPCAVGVQSEQGSDLAGRLVLHLGVPQHGLPPLRQRAEGPHGQGLLRLVHGPHIGAQVQRVVVGHLGTAGGLSGEHREVVHQMLAPGRLRPVRGDPADGGEQVGADRVLGARAPAHRLEHAGEHLGGQVVGGVPVAAAGAGIAAHGVRVAPVQLLVRRVVAPAHPRDQLGVGRRPAPRGRQRPVLALRRHAVLALRRDAGGRPPAPGAARAALARHLRPAHALRAGLTVSVGLVPPVRAHRR